MKLAPVPEGSVVLKSEEFKAIATVIRDHARLRGEDVIGSFMLTGCFRLMPEKQLVNLATFLEGYEK